MLGLISRCSWVSFNLGSLLRIYVFCSSVVTCGVSGVETVSYVHEFGFFSETKHSLG